MLLPLLSSHYKLSSVAPCRCGWWWYGEYYTEEEEPEGEQQCHLNGAIILVTFLWP